MAAPAASPPGAPVVVDGDAEAHAGLEALQPAAPVAAGSASLIHLEGGGRELLRMDVEIAAHIAALAGCLAAIVVAGPSGAGTSEHTQGKRQECRRGVRSAQS